MFACRVVACGTARPVKSGLLAEQGQPVQRGEERLFASATDAKKPKKAARLFGQNEGITSLFFSYFSGVNDLQL